MQHCQLLERARTGSAAQPGGAADNTEETHVGTASLLECGTSQTGATPSGVNCKHSMQCKNRGLPSPEQHKIVGAHATDIAIAQAAQNQKVL